MEKLVDRGQFREDLYYRLNVFPILLPPLRERKDDILELAQYFLHKHALAYQKNVKMASSEATAALQSYEWPGNIRELENAIECAVIKMSGTTIEIDDLPSKIAAAAEKNPVMSVFDYTEREAVIAALKTFGNSVEGKKKAAAALKIGIATLYRKIHKYGL